MPPFDTLMSSRSVRWSILAAILGAVIGIALTPFMAAVWSYEPGVVWSEKTLVERSFGPLLESWGLLTFGRKDLPYEVYGKGFFLVYLLMIPMARTIRPRGLGSSRLARLPGWAWRGMYGALWVALVGDLVSYWGKSVPGTVSDILWGGGFAVESLAVVALLGSTMVFGVSGWRAKALPRWASVLLILAVFAVVPVDLFITGYLPNAPVVPLSIAWAAIGIWLWLRKSPALVT